MRAAPFLSALILAVAAAPAQTVPAPKEAAGSDSQAASPSEPPALTALRHRLAESITIADRTVIAQWMTALTALEKSHAAAGAYEKANVVRLRREEALARAGTDDGRTPVKLSSRELTNKGSGLTVGESGTVALSSSGAFLEWDISGEFTGWYDVRLIHAVDGAADRTAEISPVTGLVPEDPRLKNTDSDGMPLQGGRVSFQNVSKLGGTEMVLRREIVSTGGRNAWRTVSLGRLEVTGRIAKFRLTAVEAASKGLMQFKQIDLVPASPPVGIDDSIAKLAKAREKFDREFRSQTLAATTRYREALNGIEQQALRARDTDALVRVRDEKSRLLSPEKLALGTINENGAGGAPISLEVGNSIKCQFRGEIALDSTRTSLTKLRPAGTAIITWRLPASNVGSGTYKVELKGRVPGNGGGTATLAAFSAPGVPAGTPLTVVVDPVVSREGRNKKPGETLPLPAAEERTVGPGSIVIGKGAETLTLTVTSLTYTDGWLMDLSGITLVRTGEATSTGSKR